jgi:hypothetical protein
LRVVVGDGKGSSRVARWIGRRVDERPGAGAGRQDEQRGLNFDESDSA